MPLDSGHSCTMLTLCHQRCLMGIVIPSAPDTPICLQGDTSILILT